MSTKSSFGQTLHFITEIKLQELEKQRLAYLNHAKVLSKAQAIGDSGDIVRKVEILAHAVKSWTGSGKAESKAIGGSLQLDDLQFWLLQAKHDPSFSRELAEGWAKTLEDHIRHNMRRFDSAKLFGKLFNEWLASGDSVALTYPSDDVSRDGNEDADAAGDDAKSTMDFVEIGRKEMYEQKEKLVSIIFDDYPIDVPALKAYLEELFSSSDETTRVLENLRKDLKQFSFNLQWQEIGIHDVRNAITGLLADGLMDEEKRTTLKAFLENPTVLQEVASVLNMRLAGIESWKWPKEGILVDFRRHLNGKYRAFTDPEIVDALLLQFVGVEWQVKLKHALKAIYNSKAWIRPQQLSHEAREITSEQLRRDSGKKSIDAERERDRKEKFFLTQLQDTANVSRPYDDSGASGSPLSRGDGAVMVKQRLLHMMTTECQLNLVLHRTHAAVCSDLEWFGPSLPHSTILTVLEFMGMSKVWLSFIKEFLSAPLRFPGEEGTEPRVRKRGTPISYSLSTLCGEAVIFIMDFAVNQQAKGLYLYRMHDDLWLWDAKAKKVAEGWAAMNNYAKLVGLKFNAKKTGSAYIGENAEDAVGLPEGDIHWGFLKFSTEQRGFVIDQEDISAHIVEMRRQLAKTKSVFGWVNTYNKYLGFFFRNLGGIPANCFGEAHVDAMVETLGRIQRELFNKDGGEDGSAVGYLRRVIAERFDVKDLPEGYFYFPIGSGGLELRNTMLELLALERLGKPLVGLSARKQKSLEEEKIGSELSEEGDEDAMDRDDDDTDYDDESDTDDDNTDYSSSESSEAEEPPTSESGVVVPEFIEAKAMGEHKFQKRAEHDLKVYTVLKDVWDNDRDNRYATLKQKGIEDKPFMSFDEYTDLRESWLSGWGDSYRNMLELPKARSVKRMPKVNEMMQTATDKSWKEMDWYEQWVVAMYGEEVVKKYGALNVVDPNLIPVGMVQLFNTSRIKLGQ